jgi:hypothetical protein
VRSGSPNSSLSADDRATLVPICRAKAIVDSNPFPYEKDALKYKVSNESPQPNDTSRHVFVFFLSSLLQKGDIIDVLSMNASGVWKGCSNGRVGHFKFIHVEVIPEQKGLGKPMSNSKLDRTLNMCPSTVDELLSRINLREYTSVFVLNG